MSHQLRLAETLLLPGTAVTQTFGILGVRGSGKSNTAVVMAEEMFGAKLPFVVVDPVGSWWGVRSSQDGHGPGLAVVIFGGRHADVPLDRAGGSLLADLIVEERLSCVLDVSEFSEGDKIRFLIDFAERLYRRNQDPLHLFLEEADDYAPQRPFREQARLLRAWENVVRRGRARGLGITMISQRSAALNKNVLTQIETLLVFRTTSPQDRKAIGAWVEYHGQSEDLLESLPALKDGEAWIWSPHWLGELVRARIRLRTTFDSAATPQIRTGQRPPATLADVDLQAIQKRMVATIERAKQEDPRELRRRITALEGELRVTAARVPAEAPPKWLEIPVLKEGQLKRVETWLSRLSAEADRHGRALSMFWKQMNEHAEVLLGVLKQITTPTTTPRAPLIRPHPDTASVDRSFMVRRAEREGDVAGRRGTGRVLAAIIQQGPVTRRQLTVLTGYKRSTRDAYLQRLVKDGHIALEGDRVLATAEGVAALGDSVGRLPTGERLQAYWREHLPRGEREILNVLLAEYPKAVERDRLSDKTGYKRSTRDVYLHRLFARALVVSDRPGTVRASEDLFEGGG